MTEVMLVRGDAAERWPLDDNSLDSIVTDPPYGIAFMGKEWDDKGGPQAYQEWTTKWASEAFRCLKPGGFLLAFGATRMAHRMACGFEDVGFRILYTIEWLYLSGMPKAQDIGKMFDKRAGAERDIVGVRDDFARRANKVAGREYVGQSSGTGFANPQMIGVITAPATPLAKKWDGWKTPNLKPAHEPIIVAQKPFSGTYLDNIERWGVGAINVDGCRIPTNDNLGGGATSGAVAAHPGWRRPWMEDPEALTAYAERKRQAVEKAERLGRFPANVVTLDEEEWYSPYFNITPKELSKKASPGEKKGDGWKNEHPTVKPVALIRWLQRLVTPPGGTTGSPFLGSGTDAVAALEEGFDFWGMELSEEYWSIIEARVAQAQRDPAVQQPRLFA